LFICNCKDFKENIDIIILSLIHLQGTTGKGTQLKQMKYCPWCGKKLQKMKRKKKESFWSKLF